MDVKEALVKAKEYCHNQSIHKCMEYDSLFVFHIGNTDKKIMDSLISVNKSTGVVRDFKPFHISLDEYATGKEVRLNF